MNHKYSCHSDINGTQPRGRPTTQWMQDGWRLIQRGEHMIKEAIMVQITYEPIPMLCGHLTPMQDRHCAGCVNRGEANV